VLLRAIRLVLAGAVLLATASCSDDPRLPAARPSPVVTSFVNGAACPVAIDPSFPTDAGCVTTAIRGDETLSVYALMKADGRPRSWRIRFDSPMRPIDQRLEAGNAFSYPRAVGAADVDGDGDAEWWVKVVDFTSHGAPWQRLNLFFVVGSELVPLTYEGEPLGVNDGGISRMGEGAACVDDRLMVLRAEAKNPLNTRWTTSERTFAIDGTRARLLDVERGVLEIDDYNDPDLDPYYRLDCDGLVHPS
jgi:hypothetical protein